MATKDLIGITLAIVAILGGVALACLSSRLRGLALFLLLVSAVIPYRLDMNFDSRYWYRGTTRGFEFAFADVMAISLLVSTLFLPRPSQAKRFWPASLSLMIAYFLYACFSVAISQPKLYGLFELSKIFRGIVVFLAVAWFVRSERELRVVVLALCCTVCFEGLLAVKQRALGGIYRVTGSIDHPNSLSMYLCTVSPVLVAAATSDFPKYLRRFAQLALASAAITILLTISRAGIPIFGLVVLGAASRCVSLRLTFKKAAVALVVGAALAGLVVKSWVYMKARYEEASLEEEYLDENKQGRGYYLRLAQAIVEEHFLGIGLNNWSYWVSKRYGPKEGFLYEDYDDLDYTPSKEIAPTILYAAPAHNLGALTVGELGVPGLALFSLLWLRWFWMGARFLGRRHLSRLAGALSSAAGGGEGWGEEVPQAGRFVDGRFAALLPRFGVGLFFGICGIFLQCLFEWVYRQTPIFITFNALLGVLASLYYAKRQARRLARQTTPAEEGIADTEPAGLHYSPR